MLLWPVVRGAAVVAEPIAVETLRGRPSARNILPGSRAVVKQFILTGLVRITLI